MRGPQFQNYLLLGTKVYRLLMFPPAQIPEMKMPAVLATQKHLRDQPVFYHVRCAPLTRDHRIVAKMPPEVIGQILRSAIHFPLAKHVEGLTIEQEDSSRPVPIRRP